MTKRQRQPGEHDAILADMESRGYAIVEGMLDSGGRQAVREALARHRTGLRGRNDFEGYESERIYSLLARGQIFADMAEHPTVIAVLDALLAANYLLSAALAIDLLPGETAQALHFDDAFYPLPRPRPPIGVSVIWAIDPFTAENGATQVIPGSHRWGDSTPAGVPDDPEIKTLRLGPERRPALEQELQAQLVDVLMPAGAAVIFPGTLWHRGGGNRSNVRRLAVTLQYCQPWARQQENMMLAVPRDITRQLSPKVRALMGYSIHPPFMGHIDSMHPERILRPERPETSNGEEVP